MIFISHRGNLEGKSDMENNPVYIDFALHQGFDVEIDVWQYKKAWWLGHDKPTHRVTDKWLLERRDDLWCHAKNAEGAVALDAAKLHAFGHAEDPYVFTNRGYVIVHPKAKLVPNSIVMLPEDRGGECFCSCIGVCSDIIGRYANDV